MSKKIIGTVFLGVILCSFGFSLVVSAQKVDTNPALQTPEPIGSVGSGNPADNDNFQLVPCTGVVGKDGTGKACDFEDLLTLARRIIQLVLFLMTPIVIGMILYTGFKYMFAGGDANLIADAKRMFKPIIIGIFFIFAAWILVYTILDKLLVSQIGDINKDTIVPTSVR